MLITGILLGVVISSIGINSLGINHQIKKHQTFKPLFYHYQDKQNFYKGEIIQIQDNNMTIMTINYQKIGINWDNHTRLPFGSDFRVGEWVITVGDWFGNEFDALGIEEVNQ